MLLISRILAGGSDAHLYCSCEIVVPSCRVGTRSIMCKLRDLRFLLLLLLLMHVMHAHLQRTLKLLVEVFSTCSSACAAERVCRIHGEINRLVRAHALHLNRGRGSSMLLGGTCSRRWRVWLQAVGVVRRGGCGCLP